jgi:hypothetical protein
VAQAYLAIAHSGSGQGGSAEGAIRHFAMETAGYGFA